MDVFRIQYREKKKGKVIEVDRALPDEPTAKIYAVDVLGAVQIVSITNITVKRSQI